jgi:serine/threonine protein kinase
MWGQLELRVEITAPSVDNNAPLSIPFPHPKTHITIGRRPGADVMISNPCISATHCVISKSQLKCTMEYRPRCSETSPAVTSLALHHVIVWEYTLADMSTNGCFVNGALVGKGRVCALRDGDEVQLVRAAPEKSNKYNLVYCFQADSEEISPVQPTEVAVPVVMAEDVEVEILQHRILSQRGHDEERHVDQSVSVALLEQHVAEDIAVGSDAVLAEEEHHASQQSPQLPPSSDDHLSLFGFGKETTMEALRKRHEGVVDAFYTLNRAAPLGQGSFAAVYSATLIDQPANKAVCVVRALGKSLPMYTDDETPENIFLRLLGHKFAVKVIKKSRFLCPADSQEDPLSVPQDQREIIERLLDRTPNGPALSSQEKKVLFLQLTSENRTQVERELKNRQRQQREIDILVSVRHPNIIGLFEIFDSPLQLSFVMERCDGGELFPLVQMYGALPEFFVKMVVYQVLLGVQYLHQIGIAHRDLKLENVLLSRPTSVTTLCQLQRDAAIHQRSAQQLPAAGGTMHAPPKRDRNGAQVPTVVGGDAARDIREWYHSSVLVHPCWWPDVKISDFGLSRAMDASLGGGDGTGGIAHAMSTMCGTPLYAAPEVTIPSLRISAGGYTEAVDLFSVGVLCFAMLCGRPPFPNVRDAQGRSQKGRLDYLAPLTWERRQNNENLPKGDGGAVDFRQVPFVRVSSEGRDFTAKLLRLRPAERMSASEALQHPWLRDCHTMARSMPPQSL